MCIHLKLYEKERIERLDYQSSKNKKIDMFVGFR